MSENEAVVDYLESLPTVGPDSESDGWVSMVNRGLGHGDSVYWTEGTTDSVKALQAAVGLEETGVISGKSWALVMPTFGLGDLNSVVGALHAALGVGRGNWFDMQLATALGYERLDRKTWCYLVGLDLNVKTYGELQEVAFPVRPQPVKDFPGAEVETSGAEEESITTPVADQPQVVTSAHVASPEGEVTEVNLDIVPPEWSGQAPKE